MQLCSVCVCVCARDIQYGALFWDFPLFLPTFSTLSTTHVYFSIYVDFSSIYIYTFFLPTFRRFYFERARVPHRFHSYFYILSMNLFDARSYDCWNYCFPIRTSPLLEQLVGTSFLEFRLSFLILLISTLLYRHWSKKINLIDYLVLQKLFLGI